MATTLADRCLLHLDLASTSVQSLLTAARRALGDRAAISQSGHSSSEHYLLSLAQGQVLGDVLSALTAAGITILGCREERSEIERAFLHLTREEDR